MRAPLVVFTLLTLLTGVVYPLLVTAAAAILFPDAAQGSPLRVGERRVGSALIGQAFEQPRYLWGRPSATLPTPYTAFDATTKTGSSGSNFGPLHPALRSSVRARVAALRACERALGVAAEGPVPVDLVTASASGLDPHISPAAAAYQVERVARARGVPSERVAAIVERHTVGRQLGFLGEPVVHVLGVNLELDRELGTREGR